ncbi:putative ribosomal N-acetyltransferase YdaF [bacterium BMS3Abin03]|nr:putative ribosomal N-acetyltransferase YdaF [bacterium BMS3Abin03]
MKIVFGEYKIRSFHPTDKEAILKYANNINVSKNLRDSFPYPYTGEDADAWLKLACSQKSEMNFAIANKHELIGGIGLMPQTDVYRYSAEIGYWLAEQFWGRNIASSAVIAMTKYAFNSFNFIRLFANVFEFNPASARVLEKAGYKFEGSMRKAVYKNCRFWDQLMYSILKEETI